MKHRIIVSLLALILLGMSVAGLSACSGVRGDPPELDEVYDRLVAVIEASHEVNVLLFGAGLPVYPRGDAEDELVHRYYGVTDNGQEYVTPYAKYNSIADMQAAIAAVYGTEYREALFSTFFTGYVAENMSLSLPARFSEDEKSLYQNVYVDPLVKGTRVYDYASMEIMSGSHASYIQISIRSYTEDKPMQWQTVYLSFVYENGNWYLDSPSC